jgi:hypothetical protein
MRFVISIVALVVLFQQVALTGLPWAETGAEPISLIELCVVAIVYNTARTPREATVVVKRDRSGSSLPGNKGCGSC